MHGICLFNYDKLMLTANNISLKRVRNKKKHCKRKRYIKLSRDIETESFSSPLWKTSEGRIKDTDIVYYSSQ